MWKHKKVLEWFGFLQQSRCLHHSSLTNPEKIALAHLCIRIHPDRWLCSSFHTHSYLANHVCSTSVYSIGSFPVYVHLRLDSYNVSQGKDRNSERSKISHPCCFKSENLHGDGLLFCVNWRAPLFVSHHFLFPRTDLSPVRSMHFSTLWLH